MTLVGIRTSGPYPLPGLCGKGPAPSLFAAALAKSWVGGERDDAAGLSLAREMPRHCEPLSPLSNDNGGLTQTMILRQPDDEAARSSATSSKSKRSGVAEAAKWSLAALLSVFLCAGIWFGAFALYFDVLEDECRGTFDQLSGTAIEGMIGAAPLWARNLLLSEASFKVAKKLSVRRRGALGLVAAILLGVGLSLWSADGLSSSSKAVFIIGASILVTLCTYVLREACHRASGFDVSSGLTRVLLVGSMDELAERAGWLAIVEGDPNTPQSNWLEARESRKLSHRQAVASSITRLALWHWSQPLVYMWMLKVYRCYVASLGATQIYLATVVAAREVIYLCSTLLALKECPVFLLLDPFTVWKESQTYRQSCYRLATYLLTPYNYVASCLVRRFKDSWLHQVFYIIAGIQVVADLSSCFALGALIASGIQSDQQPPTALVIGYVITASSFVLFFGPLVAFRSIRAATDKQRDNCVRTGLAVAGAWLLCALLCLVVLFAVLIGTSLNPYCAVWALHSDRCSNHGICYGAGQCRCTVGYGPEVAYTNEALCGRPNMPCTGGQLARTLESRDAEAAQICCSHRGALITGGCRCDIGYGPVTPINELRPVIPLCGIECYDPMTHTHSSCSGHGSCSNATNFMCKCDQAFSGKQCESRTQWFSSSRGAICAGPM